VYFLLDYNQLN